MGGLRRVTEGYRGLREGYGGLRRVTEGYGGLREGYGGLRRITGITGMPRTWCQAHGASHMVPRTWESI